MSSIRRTSRGWRWSQNGTVLSEMLRQPGPTHSVFDILAAGCLAGKTVRDIALLGFGGGAIVAALRALRCGARIHAVDLDATGWNLLTQAGARWLEPISWYQEDACQWLQTTGSFDAVLEDLSVPSQGDILKPDATWHVLPRLVFNHLRPGGRAFFNLLRRPKLSWLDSYKSVAKPFGRCLSLILDDFENRILVTERLPAGKTATLEPRSLGREVRHQLKVLGSRQSHRLRVSRVGLTA